MKTLCTKSKGFFFTLSVISLLTVFFTLILLSSQLRQTPVPLLVFEKVTYSWEDISEGIPIASGINAVKVDNMLTIQDELPATHNVSKTLSTYFSFVRNFYNNSTNLYVALQSPTGQEITNDFSCFGKKNCNDDIVQFHVLPFNLTYQYPSLDKRQRDVVCYDEEKEGFPKCDFTKTSALNISINLTSINFSCDPGIYGDCTQADMEWDPDFDKVFGCTSGANCINYSLTIRDAASHVYACRGVYGPNSGNTKRVNCDASTLKWHEDSEATFQIKSSSCKVYVKFGHSGRFRVEGTAPGGASCDINMSTSASFTFNTSDFYLDFSSDLLVRDPSLNYSITAPIQ